MWRTSRSQFASKFSLRGALAPIISPDAKVMVCFREQVVELYDLDSGGQLLSQPCRNDPSRWDRAWIAADGTIIGIQIHESNKWQMTLHNSPELSELEPVVTPTRVFHYDVDASKHRTAIDNDAPLRGQFDTHLKAVCQHCGKRSVVPESAKDAIYEIIDLVSESPEKSPCLHLSEEAWTQPGLRIHCEHCDGPLRLNPFVA